MALQLKADCKMIHVSVTRSILNLNSMSSIIALFIVSSFIVRGCYWRHHYPYPYYGSKTPYETIRGDIRDQDSPDYCEPISLWSIHRHGNRYPSSSLISKMAQVIELKEEICNRYSQGFSQLCAQDIENLKTWLWNTTLNATQNFLTPVGYDEMYNLGKRVRHQYRHLLHGNYSEFYFRPTNLQRAIQSCKAFVEGLTKGTNLNVTIDKPWETDEVLRPYQKCARYQKEGQLLTQQLHMYFMTSEFQLLQSRMQKRLGLLDPLEPKVIYVIYDLCRFYRSWNSRLRDAWCAMFTDEDLVILEYYDDVKDYYKNGYGSMINAALGEAPLRDLYKMFTNVVKGGGKKIVAYFTHDAAMQMAWCALGLHADADHLMSINRNPNRRWRTSFFSPFASNMIAVLHSCNESDLTTHRVQIFINEKIVPVCPSIGCSWAEFEELLESYEHADLSFCNLENFNGTIRMNSSVS